MVTFNPQAYTMYSRALEQIQARIRQWNAQMAKTPAGSKARKLTQIALDRDNAALRSTQAGLKQQTAAYPVQVNEAGYGQQKADINQQFGAQIAAADYGRGLAQQRHARAQTDFSTNASRQRLGADSQYLRRGIFNSGIRRQGLGDLRSDQARQFGAMNEQQAGELGTMAQQRQLLLTGKQSALNAIDRARQAEIHRQLAGLQALR